MKALGKLFRIIVMFGLYKNIVLLLSLPVILRRYFSRRTGEEYNVGFFTKLSLVFKMIRNNLRILSASSFMEHLAMATEILNIPKSVEGCVVECGSYKGGSASNLSLVCKLTKRDLEIFDSFQGIPEPSGRDKVHHCYDIREAHVYSGGYSCGSLKEVKDNITKYGRIEVCNFNVGYFDKSMPAFKKKCVFAFVDVDLIDSLEPCIKYLWPLLEDNSYFFTHEAHHMEIAFLFFDKDWWRTNLKCDPPGLVGAGNGLGLVPDSGGFRSAIGYCIKNPKTNVFKEIVQVGFENINETERRGQF